MRVNRDQNDDQATAVLSSLSLRGTANISFDQAAGSLRHIIKARRFCRTRTRGYQQAIVSFAKFSTGIVSTQRGLALSSALNPFAHWILVFRRLSRY